MNDPRYPIGRFAMEGEPGENERQTFINQIAETPTKLREAVRNLTDGQLDTPYREGGWTVRQVVHHLPDSHLNAYTRFKLALTEDAPTIKPYDEARWAELEDARTAPVEMSLALLEALHKRWVILLESLTTKDFKRSFRHTELGVMPLDKTLALYAWHGRHHVAHITHLREQMDWH